MLYLSGLAVRGIPPIKTPNSDHEKPSGVWAADNGCFTQPRSYTDERYLAFLAARDPSECLFATAPDVVGDAAATLARSRPMLARIRDLGYPAALVAQDGLTVEDVPWDEIDAIFIGGTTEWKLGLAVPPLVAEAKRLGKWAHMGRVNSWSRFDYARSLGCDSVDGTFIKFGPDKNAPKVREWVERAKREPHIWSRDPDPRGAG